MGGKLIRVENGHLVDDSLTPSAVISPSVLHSEATKLCFYGNDCGGGVFQNDGPSTFWATAIYENISYVNI